jgi:thiol:disulfide interchange protein DsbD
MVIGLPMAMAIGLAFGLSACTISCLPYLAPLFLAADGGVARSWRILLPFSFGRLCGYGALAAVAGLAGRYLGNHVTDSGQVRALVGVAAIMVGIALWRRRPATCAAKPAETAPLRRMDYPAAKALMPAGLFLLGVGMTLTPCAPLGVVVFSAALSGSATHGLLLGLGFGLGTVVVPSLIYGIGAAHMGEGLRRQLGRHSHTLTRVSASLLVLTGVGNLVR